MMKRTAAMILALLMMLSAFASVSAGSTASGTCGNALTWAFKDGVLTISGTGAMNDYRHWKISPMETSNPAPWDGLDIKSVVINQGVTSIGNDAFYECTSITNVSLPQSLTSLGEYAFYHCAALPLSSLPDSITDIGRNCFTSCLSITSFTIPPKVHTLNVGVFANTAITSMTIPDTVKEMKYAAFSQCHQLVSVVLPKGIHTIERGLFEKCTALKNIEIPISVTVLGPDAFSGCTALEHIDLPKKLTHLEGCFERCTALKEIDIPDSVIVISENTFLGCSSLTQVKIGSGVERMGKSVFSGTPILDNSLKQDGMYIVDGWLCHCEVSGDIVIPEGTVGIASMAFYWQQNLTSIVISEGVKYIGDYAFQGCTNLQSINFPFTLETVGEQSFDQCKSLTQARFKSLRRLESRSFLSCTSLQSIYLPANLAYIGADVYSSIPFTLHSITYEGSEAAYNALNGGSAFIKAPIDDSPCKITFLGKDKYASPNTASVYLNGKKISLPAYTINDTNYVKIRDIAMLLNNTDSRFSVDWDAMAKMVQLTPMKEYSPVGGELSSLGTEKKIALPSSASFSVGNGRGPFTAFFIDNNNYVNLREVGKYLSFGVEWNSEKSAIEITA